MQKIASTISATEENAKIQWESFELGNRQILLDDANEAEMKTIIDDLGLEGQKKLITSQGETIVPFPKMTAQELLIWQEYAPYHVKLEAFAAQVIPYEVIQVLALVKHKMYFGYIEVWSETTDEIDPLIVGVIEEKTGPADYQKNVHRYLVARWGHALKDFDAICKTVRETWKEKRIAALKAAHATIDHCLLTIENDAFKKFSGSGWIESSLYF